VGRLRIVAERFQSLAGVPERRDVGKPDGGFAEADDALRDRDARITDRTPKETAGRRHRAVIRLRLIIDRHELGRGRGPRRRRALPLVEAAGLVIDLCQLCHGSTMVRVVSIG